MKKVWETAVGMKETSTAQAIPSNELVKQSCDPFTEEYRRSRKVIYLKTGGEKTEEKTALHILIIFSVK